MIRTRPEYASSGRERAQNMGKAASEIDVRTTARGHDRDPEPALRYRRHRGPAERDLAAVRG